MNEFSKKEFRRHANWSSALLVLFTVAINVFAIALSAVAPMILDKNLKSFSTAVQFFGFMVQNMLVIPGAILLMRLTPYGKTSARMPPLFRKPEQSAMWIARWIVIIVGMTYAANFASSIMISILNILTNNAIHVVSIDIDDDIFSQVVIPIATVILAPIFEEIMLRATIANDGQKYGTWSVIIISGIMFGLWHCNIGQTALAVVLGAGSAFLLYKTKSIYPCFLVHFCLNIFGTISSVIVGIIGKDDLDNVSDMVESGHFGALIAMLGLFGIIMMLIVSAFIFIVLEFIFHRDSFKLEPKSREVSEMKKLAIYFTSPVTVVAVLIFVGLTIYNNIL